MRTAIFTASGQESRSDFGKAYIVCQDPDNPDKGKYL